jgi:uncharacterized protein YggE
MLRICGVLTISLMTSMVATAAEPSASAQPTIRVVANSTVAMKPDRAQLILGVTTDKKTATAATAENDKKMEQVLAVLKKEVGADGEVKTAELNVVPRLSAPQRGQPNRPIVGYTVTNTLHVRVADIRSVGRLIDRAFQAGANTVERLEFSVKNPDGAQNEALRAASAKARARATAMADGLGLRVGHVLSVSEGDEAETFIARNIRANADKVGGASTPIEPGSIEVTATVTVVFALAAR